MNSNKRTVHVYGDRGETVVIDIPMNYEARITEGNLSLHRVPNFFDDATTVEDWKEKVRSIEACLADGLKIKAIKHFREMFPFLGLREAKYAVEAMDGKTPPSF
jgi:hypothetical protein